MTGAERPPVDTVDIAAATGEIIAAFYADGVLVRLEVGGSGSDRRVGEICLGRVRRVERDIEAAFVDIGGDCVGFLNRADAGGAAAPRRLPGEGDAILVQISREAEAAKAAKLTAAVALPGRTVIYRPSGADLRVSRRIADGPERERLRRLGANLPEAGGGWFIRHAALTARSEAILAEAETLLAQWGRLEARAAAATASARLYRSPDPVLAAIAEVASPGLRRIRADEPGMLAAIRTRCPELAASCTLEIATGPVAVDAAIEAALEPSVTLPGGGAIHFAETPALVAIDVDAGNRRGGGGEQTALAANLEAVEALALHIGLRDLAGHLVIDFVGMRRRAHRERIVESLRAAFAHDRQETHVAGYTRLGKVELMRRRLRGSLRDRLGRSCPCCRGAGTILAPGHVAHGALRALLQASRNATATSASVPGVLASPDVAAALRGAAADGVAKVGHRLGREPIMREDPRMAASTYRLETDMESSA